MNWNRIEGDSKHFKGHARYQMEGVKGPQNVANGKRGHVAGKRHAMYDINKEEVEHELQNWQKGSNSRSMHR